MHSAHDRNLLFGILALQLDFITQVQLIETMQAWLLNKNNSLSEVFVERGLLTTQRRSLLETLVAEHVSQHNNDPEKSLAAVGLGYSIRKQLDALGDPAISMAAARLHTSAPMARPPVDMATMPHIAREDDVVPLRFTVVRPLAEGGLGIVSVAHDTELSREVALKEIKAAYADHVDSRARFLKEAEITGRLEHPGIVPVYGLGAYPDGRPFYAMRMIKGESLKEATDEFHAKDAKPREARQRSLELRELLRRFLDVCNAIDYAHSRGIVHRDLKPANIMLGKYGETLVVDWGLAKSVGETEKRSLSDKTVIVPELGLESVPTQVGEVVGTIAYMSPEQASGRHDAIGPGTDIYALGATLYNLLTGKLSQTGTDAGALLRNIINGKFPRPREVKKDLPFALEAICMKAMATRPPDRYHSARSLADDLEHYLADEPITAAQEPLLHRTQRWFRKHPRTMSALPVALTALGLIAGIATWSRGELRDLNRHLQVAKDDAVKSRDIAEAAKVEAQLQQKRAEEERDIANEVKSFIVNIFHSANPEKDGKEVKVVEFINDGAAYLAQEFQGTPFVKRELLSVLADTYASLKLYADATPLLEEAVAVDRLLNDKNPYWTIDDLDRLATMYQNQGRMDRAKEVFEAALQEAETWYQANLEPGDRLIALQKLLKLKHNLAASYLYVGDLVTADRLLRENVPLVEREFPETDINRAILWQVVADSGRSLGNYTTALADIEKAIQALEPAKAPDDAPNSKEIVRLQINTTKGAILRELGRYDESLALLRTTLEKSLSVHGQDDPYTLNTKGQLARTLHHLGKIEEALPLYEQVQDGLLGIPKSNHEAAKSLVRLQSELALGYLDSDRIQEAHSLLESTMELRAQILGPSNIGTLTAKCYLAGILCDLDRIPEALTLAKGSLELQQSTLPKEHPAIRQCLQQLQRIQILARDYEDALKTIAQWQQSLKENGMAKSLEALRADTSMASSLESLNRREEAMAALQPAKSFADTLDVPAEDQLRIEFLKTLWAQTKPGTGMESLQAPFVALTHVERLPARQRWYAVEACDKLIDWLKLGNSGSARVQKAMDARANVLRKIAQ